MAAHGLTSIVGEFGFYDQVSTVSVCTQLRRGDGYGSHVNWLGSIEAHPIDKKLGGIAIVDGKHGTAFFFLTYIKQCYDLIAVVGRGERQRACGHDICVFVEQGHCELPRGETLVVDSESYLALGEGNPATHKLTRSCGRGDVAPGVDVLRAVVHVAPAIHGTLFLIGERALPVVGCGSGSHHIGETKMAVDADSGGKRVVVMIEIGRGGGPHFDVVGLSLRQRETVGKCMSDFLAPGQNVLEGFAHLRTAIENVGYLDSIGIEAIVAHFHRYSLVRIVARERRDDLRDRHVGAAASVHAHIVEIHAIGGVCLPSGVAIIVESDVNGLARPLAKVDAVVLPHAHPVGRHGHHLVGEGRSIGSGLRDEHAEVGARLLWSGLQLVEAAVGHHHEVEHTILRNRHGRRYEPRVGGGARTGDFSRRRLHGISVAAVEARVVFAERGVFGHRPFIGGAGTVADPSIGQTAAMLKIFSEVLRMKRERCHCEEHE